MWNNDFRHRFAEYADCNPAEFESRVFWRSLYLHAIPLAWLVKLLAPHFFRLDFEIIDRVGQTFDSREFMRDLDRYRYLNRQAHSLLRSLLLVRVSGKRLIRLRRRVERELAARAEAALPVLHAAR